jgi:hypothetical protein
MVATKGALGRLAYLLPEPHTNYHSNYGRYYALVSISNPEGPEWLSPPVPTLGPLLVLRVP